MNYPVSMLAEAQSDVPHAIQLALAPISLLTGMAGMLNVMASRLGRIIDRSRKLIETQEDLNRSPESVACELRYLELRRRLAGGAITARTISALLVCVVITALFLEASLALPLKWLEGILFTVAAIALVIGLATFLREVRLANRTAGSELPGREIKPIPDNQ